MCGFQFVSFVLSIFLFLFFWCFLDCFIFSSKSPDTCFPSFDDIFPRADWHGEDDRYEDTKGVQYRRVPFRARRYHQQSTYTSAQSIYRKEH